MLMLAKSRAAREQSSREDTLIVTGYRDNNTFLLSELSRYGTVYGAAEQLCADLFTDRALRNELLFIPIRSARQTESFPLDGASDREKTGAVPFTEGTVLDAIKAFELSADVIYACGPKPMLKAVKDFALEKGIPAWLSLEERMACGVGVCLGCVCETAEPDPHSLVTNKRVCREGPVFAAEEVIL
ncbi:MAG: hypothetical protein K6G83_07370 [Lachnospiraceae bacterium]|nr:hypothetical protein [Lachnospiraceae bacterium]